jgi:hypothetical protein
MDLPFLKNRNEVDFLVERRFPDAMAIRGRAASLTRFPGDEKTAREMTAYANELEVMPEAEFQALLAQEKSKEGIELEARATREEAERFFNQPAATADFSHWSRAAYWTVDEASALSFGKNPLVVNWNTIAGYVDCSPFAQKYHRLRDLIIRAESAQQLSARIAPGFFIAWMQQNRIPFPTELAAAVATHGVQIADWKTHYEEAAKALEMQAIQLQDTSNRLLEIMRERDLVQLRNNELEAQVNAHQRKEKALNPKERSSVLTLIISMAIKSYGYDPQKSHNAAIKRITSHVYEIGLKLDEDTVRDWLKDGAFFLSEKSN